MSKLDIREAAAFWQLGLLISEELVEIAILALENGYDSRSLRILAGETEIIGSTVDPLFVKALHELGISLPDGASALMTAARVYARKIVDGSMSPHLGARHIGDYVRLWRDVSNNVYSTQNRFKVFNRLSLRNHSV